MKRQQLESMVESKLEEISQKLTHVRRAYMLIAIYTSIAFLIIVALALLYYSGVLNFGYISYA